MQRNLPFTHAKTRNSLLVCENTVRQQITLYKRFEPKAELARKLQKHGCTKRCMYVILTDSKLIPYLSCSIFECYFANRNEFMRDSSRIEPFPPNIRNDIVHKSGLTRRTSRSDFFLIKPHESPRIKKQFAAVRAIRGLCGIWVIGILELTPPPPIL